MSAILNFVRGIVSAKKFRFKEDGFDLDLTYITPRIIAMGFPAAAVEGMYRNNLEDVAELLKRRHNGKFMIWNLSEREYDYSRVDNQVLDFGFPDHTAPPLELLFKITASMASWLNADPENVAVVHCMAGLGRTGTVICAYMLFSGMCTSATAALRFFGQRRCRDGRGVRIPSQIRYVHYYEQVMKGRQPDPLPINLKKVVVQPIPFADRGFQPILQVWATASNKLVWSSSEQPGGLRSYTAADDVVVFDVDLVVMGDVTVRCFHLSNARNHMPISIMSQTQVFRIMFHTAFVGTLLRCGKSDMDWAFNNKNLSDRLTVDLMFSRDVENTTPHYSDEQACWSALTQRIVAEAPDDPESPDDESDDEGSSQGDESSSASAGASPPSGTGGDATGPLAPAASLRPAAAVSATGATTAAAAAAAASAASSGPGAATASPRVGSAIRTAVDSGSRIMQPSPAARAISAAAAIDGDVVAAAAARAARSSLTSPIAPIVPSRPAAVARTLMLAVLNTVPRFTRDGCMPCAQVWRGAELIATVRADRMYTADDVSVRLDMGGLLLNGPVVFKFFDTASSKRPDLGSWTLMFSVSLEPSQIADDVMCFTRSHVQCTAADREKLDPDFRLDLVFQPR